MNDRQRQRTTTRCGPGFGRRLLAAFLTAAEEALAQSRAEADEAAGEDDQCRLRPDHSRLTRGYEEL